MPKTDSLVRFIRECANVLRVTIVTNAIRRERRKIHIERPERFKQDEDDEDYHIAKSKELQLDFCSRRSDGLPNITEAFYDECFQHVALGHWDIQGPYAARKCTSSGMSPLHQYQIQHYRG
jgi:hypothetical protein